MPAFMRALLHSVLALALMGTLHAAVVNPAPDFAVVGAGNKLKSLKSLRGQPVILVLARSPRTGDFKRQIARLEKDYGQFASRSAIFVAAFQEEDGQPVRSDVPFAVASNGPGVHAAYGVQDSFCIVLIGKDGNIDYQTNKVLPGQRIRDVLQNSFVVQQQERK